jgi:hypothetical protein
MFARLNGCVSHKSIFITQMNFGEKSSGPTKRHFLPMAIMLNGFIVYQAVDMNLVIFPVADTVPEKQLMYGDALLIMALVCYTESGVD